MKQTLLPIIVFCLLTLTVFSQIKEARKFDEFGELPCDELHSRLSNLANGLEKESISFAFIILYEGKHHVLDLRKEKYVLPRFGEDLARTRTMQRLLDFMKFNESKFIFTSGGFREKYWVEFWIIPKGAKLPKATPTLERMNYRKGTPTNICREF